MARMVPSSVSTPMYACVLMRLYLCLAIFYQFKATGATFFVGRSEVSCLEGNLVVGMNTAPSSVMGPHVALTVNDGVLTKNFCVAFSHYTISLAYPYNISKKHW